MVDSDRRLNLTQHSRLEPGEREVIISLEACLRELKSGWIAPECRPGDSRTAGVVQPDDLSYLVKCFTDSIVNRLSDQLIVTVVVK